MPWLAHVAVIWMLVAAVEVALSALIPDTALSSGQLPFGARIGLVAYGLAVLAACVGAIVVPLLLLARLSRPDAHPAFRWAIGGLQLLAVGSVVLLYATSWAAFWNTGVFLDREGFAFWAPHPLQVFFWVYPPLVIAVIGVTLIAAVFFGRWVPQWVAHRSAVLQRRLVFAASGAVGVCLVVAMIGTLAYGKETTEDGQAKSRYAVTRDDHTAPLLHALATRRRLPPVPELPAAMASNGAKVTRRPIISMEQYLAGVTRDTFKRRNVVMVQIESLRSDQLRAYGGTRDVMPTVDALARESRVFTNAYIQASHSNYADLVPLSSHYPLRSAKTYIYPENPTYPRVLIYDLLKALGYKTAIISSQNENWGGMINFHRPSSLDRFFHAETFDGPTYAPFGDVGFAAWVKETKSAGSVDDRYTVGEAIQWLDSLGADQPFFLHMNLQSSHVPYVVPEGFKRPFGPDKLDFTIMWGKFPLEKVDIVKDRYADSLFYEDTQIARLFEYLKGHGLWDNTVIVVGGDNGEAFYEHDLAAHASTLFNEVVKVPMIIKAPGVEPGLDDRPAMFLDIPPSVCQLLGIPAHPSFQGISLFERQPNPNRSVYTIVQTPLAFQSAIVRSGFKLLFTEWDGRYFLWDLVHDPGERNNVASDRPELVQEMGDRLRAWRGEQLSYYADVSRHSREYPPVLED